MTYRGKYSKGTVTLPRDVDIPDGAEVEVTPVAPKPKLEGNGATLAQKLLAHAGKAKDLPPDAAVNLDHYLYGTPSR